MRVSPIYAHKTVFGRFGKKHLILEEGCFAFLQLMPNLEKIRIFIVLGSDLGFVGQRKNLFQPYVELTVHFHKCVFDHIVKLLVDEIVEGIS